MTVSRVVNGTASVDPVLAERVRQAVAQLGYVPNGMARQLRGGRSGLVAAIFPTLQESIYLPLVQALAEALAGAGFELVVGQSHFHPQEEAELLEDLIGRRPDALLVIGGLRTRRGRAQAERSRVPLIELWDFDATSRHPSIGVQHADIGAAVARHFAAQGRRRLAYIGADEERSRKRCEAFAAQAGALGLEPPAVLYVDPPTTVRLGREAFCALWHRNAPAVDAVFCSSDILALGVLTEFSCLGLAPGRQVALMGFGDFAIGREGVVRLSTVQIDLQMLAQRAVQQLLAGAGALHCDIGFGIAQRDT